LDIALQFNENKLVFDSAFAIASDKELVSHFNSSDNYVRLIATRNTSEALSSNGVIAHLKFELLNPCEVVYSTYLDSVHTWLNGEVSGFEIIDGSTLPDPIQIGSNAPYCVGAPIEFSYSDTFNGNAIENYSWSFGDGTVASGQSVSASITAPGATPVVLTLTGVNGCTYQVPTEIFVSTSPVASFTYTYNAETELVTFTNGSTIASGSISSYNWNFGDGNSSAETNPTYTYTSPGIFTVVLTATSAQGCSAVYDVQVNASVGVQELAQSNSLQVYPNPVMETLNVVSTTGGVVYVTDLSGRVVLQNEKLNAGFNTKIDVSSLAQGVYQVIMQGDASMQSMRIVKIN